MCILFHKWGKWEDVASGSYTFHNPFTGGEGGGDYVEQHRRCDKCNKLKARTVHQ